MLLQLKDQLDPFQSVFGTSRGRDHAEQDEFFVHDDETMRIAWRAMCATAQGVSFWDDDGHIQSTDGFTEYIIRKTMTTYKPYETDIFSLVGLTGPEQKGPDISFDFSANFQGILVHRLSRSHLLKKEHDIEEMWQQCYESYLEALCLTSRSLDDGEMARRKTRLILGNDYADQLEEAYNSSSRKGSFANALHDYLFTYWNSICTSTTHYYAHSGGGSWQALLPDKLGSGRAYENNIQVRRMVTYQNICAGMKITPIF